MQETDTTQHDNTTTQASPEKKPFVAPTLEKMDVALTESGAGGFSNSDLATYAS
ncbi:MAG TPA: hypothetical protein VGE28_20610 [Pseudomonas sp.]